MIDSLSLRRSCDESKAANIEMAERRGRHTGQAVIDAHKLASGYGEPYFFISGPKSFPPCEESRIYHSTSTEHGPGQDPFHKKLFSWHIEYLSKKRKEAMDGFEHFPFEEVHSGIMKLTDYAGLSERIPYNVFALVDNGFNKTIYVDFDQFRKAKRAHVYSLPRSGKIDFTLGENRMSHQGYILNGVTMNIPEPLTKPFIIDGLEVRFCLQPDIQFHMAKDNSKSGQCRKGLVLRDTLLSSILSGQKTYVNIDLMNI